MSVNKVSKDRNGFAGLFILIAVAIMMVLMMIQMKTLFQPGRGYRKSTAPASRPWLQDELLVPDDRLIQLPRPPKPALDKPFSFTVPVTRKDNDRGEITIDFLTTGEVAGTWQCRYSHENIDYTYNATFKGNIDVSNTYSDKQGEDLSKLYFFTKGDYSQTIYNRESEEESFTEGLVYTTGWMDPDHSVSGTITITTDRSWSADYQWQSQPGRTVN